MKNKELTEITVEQWIQYLCEMHADPDYWCNYEPADYGYIIKGEDNEK